MGVRSLKSSQLLLARCFLCKYKSKMLSSDESLKISDKIVGEERTCAAEENILLVITEGI